LYIHQPSIEFGRSTLKVDSEKPAAPRSGRGEEVGRIPTIFRDARFSGCGAHASSGLAVVWDGLKSTKAWAAYLGDESALEVVYTRRPQGVPDRGKKGRR